MWTILKIVKKGDYLYAIVPDHPCRTKKNYVLHHRIVVENHLNRLLNDDEIVHHINEIKHDNRIENLIVMSVSEHTTLHNNIGQLYIETICPVCNKMFIRRKNNSFLIKRTKHSFCSRECNGISSKNSMLHEEQKIIREFRLK